MLLTISYPSREAKEKHPPLLFRFVLVGSQLYALQTAILLLLVLFVYTSALLHCCITRTSSGSALAARSPSAAAKPQKSR